jgi:type IV secretory pathway TrbL component
MLHPLFNNFGTEYVLVYDVFVSAILIGFYKLILFLNKKTLAKKNIDIRIVSTIPIMLLYIFAFLNFLNDFGFAFHIGVFQNITEFLRLNSMYKILGG